MNSTTFLDRVEIQLYSSLISIMSGINRLKSPPEPGLQFPDHEAPEINSALAGVQISAPMKMVSISWVKIQQVLLSLLLWVILGFAAGFLIGMIRPG